MDFGSYIRQLRRENNLTQRSFAEQLGVDFTYISKIENNKVDNPPSEDVIRKMAQILETDEEALLDLAGKFDQDALRRIVADASSPFAKQRAYTKSNKKNDRSYRGS